MSRYMLRKEVRAIVEGVVKGRGVVIRYEEEKEVRMVGGASEVGGVKTSTSAAGNFRY